MSRVLVLMHACVALDCIPVDMGAYTRAQHGSGCKGGVLMIGMIRIMIIVLSTRMNMDRRSSVTSRYGCEVGLRWHVAEY